MDLQDIEDTFERYVKTVYPFNFNLKKEQLSIIHAVLNDRNALGILPTGFGKSMCYVLPPLILDEVDWDKKHTALVVSPLKSLMLDQTKLLHEMNVTAAVIGGEMSKETFQSIIDGKYSILFTSPEAIIHKNWKKMLLEPLYREQLCLLAFDEAHCISEWGEDFRPEYKEVSLIRSIVDAPSMVLTATCTTKIQQDIYKTLSLTEDELTTVAVVPDRPNILLHVRKVKEETSILLDWLLVSLKEQQERALKTIVYCRSISITSEFYITFMEQLCENGMSCSPDCRLVEMFHKNIDEDSQKRILNEFCKPESHIRLLFSTVAFGMGVQIPDVKLVVHWGAPKSILSYWQEIGRAGRDGNLAFAVCLWYGRSMDKRRTDESVKKLFVECESKCLRVEILSHLMVKGMSNEVIDGMKNKKKCGGNCNDVCRCAFCVCCAVCFAKCSCCRKQKYFWECMELNDL